MIDPYPTPFEWNDSLRADDDPLYGLLPCDCEQGWLPLLNGEFTECPNHL